MRKLVITAVIAFALLMPAGPAWAFEPQYDPLEGFDFAAFLDTNLDGIADGGVGDDSNGLGGAVPISAPFIAVGSFDGFSCSKSLMAGCMLDVQGGKQIIKLTAGRSSGIGDAGIIREFSAGGGQIYFATATVSILDDPNNPVVYDPGTPAFGDHFWARLTIAGANGSSQVNECNTELVPHLSKNGVTGSGDPDPVIETLQIPSCTLPSGINNVKVKIRAHSNSLAWGGVVVVHSLTFRRAASL